MIVVVVTQLLVFVSKLIELYAAVWEMDDKP